MSFGNRFRLQTSRRGIASRALALLSLVAIASYAEGQPGAGAAQRTQPVYFHTDVVPLLTKLGCNGGGCHGKATGQNGFKLSLLGYEPGPGYDALVHEARG